MTDNNYVAVEVDFNAMSNRMVVVRTSRMPSAVAMPGRAVLLLDNDGQLTAEGIVHSYHRPVHKEGEGFWSIEVTMNTFRDWVRHDR